MNKPITQPAERLKPIHNAPTRISPRGLRRIIGTAKGAGAVSPGQNPMFRDTNGILHRAPIPVTVEDTTFFYARIDDWDENDPRLHSWIEVAPSSGVVGDWLDVTGGREGVLGEDTVAFEVSGIMAVPKDTVVIMNERRGYDEPDKMVYVFECKAPWFGEIVGCDVADGFTTVHQRGHRTGDIKESPLAVWLGTQDPWAEIGDVLLILPSTSVLREMSGELPVVGTALQHIRGAAKWTALSDPGGVEWDSENEMAPYQDLPLEVEKCGP